MEGIVGITYRCNAKCHMCNTWQFPTLPAEEIKPELLTKLPQMKFTNITGGEPFLRQDIEDIVDVLKEKTKRIVISTNGFFTKKIVAFAKKYPQIGFRISIEGLPKTNDELRGIKDGFDKGLRTVLELQSMGLQDIGFGITVSDANAKDLLELYKLAKAMKLEFATAITHNSYYFHKDDNQIKNKNLVVSEFNKLATELLRSNRVKDWFRAYFNYGITHHINGGKRLLPCAVGTDVFYLDPFGKIRPCNAMDEEMGNLHEHSFEDIWQSDRAQEVRELIKACDRRCWMIGSVSPAMRKNILKPAWWIVRNKYFSNTKTAR